MTQTRVLSTRVSAAKFNEWRRGRAKCSNSCHFSEMAFQEFPFPLSTTQGPSRGQSARSIFHPTPGLVVCISINLSSFPSHMLSLVMMRSTGQQVTALMGDVSQPARMTGIIRSEGSVFSQSQITAKTKTTDRRPRSSCNSHPPILPCLRPFSHTIREDRPVLQPFFAGVASASNLNG